MPGKGTLGERLARHRCPSLLKEHYYYNRLHDIAPLCVVPRPAGVAPGRLSFWCARWWASPSVSRQRMMRRARSELAWFCLLACQRACVRVSARGRACPHQGWNKQQPLEHVREKETVP